MKRIFIYALCLLMLPALSSCGFAAQISNPDAAVGSPYWVESGVRLVSGDTIIFEDEEGIYTPIASHDRQKVIYSNGLDQLFLYNLTNGKRTVMYKSGSADYRVYVVGWSADDSQIALITSNSGGFEGGNELLVVDVKNKKSSIVTKALNSADWGEDGLFIVADTSGVKIIDGMGRTQKTLTTPPMNAFYTATNPAFSPDEKYVTYSCGETYYVHDIESDTYTEMFDVSAAYSAGRINGDGVIIVANDGELDTYDTKTQTSEVYFDKADCTDPNW